MTSRVRESLFLTTLDYFVIVLSQKRTSKSFQKYLTLLAK